MSFWGRAISENNAAEYTRKLAALMTELNRSAFCTPSVPRKYLTDMRDLDALECHDRWPEPHSVSG
jgi:hypothetical protein